MPRTIVYQTPSEPVPDDHCEVSPTTLGLLRAVALPGHFAIDVGCGEGRFTFEVARRVAQVIGIDRDKEAIDKAQSTAHQRGMANVDFFVADAETDDYCEFLTFEPYDLVTAHLCMSEAIIRRAYQALRPGGHFLFAALEASQWRETGHVSPFAFQEAGLQSFLEGAGFATEYMGVETRVLQYERPEQLSGQWLKDGQEMPRWLKPDRIDGLRRHVQAGGTTLTTRSHLIGRAMKGK